MRRVAITGLGAVSGAGNGVAALWNKLCEGGTAVHRVSTLHNTALDIGPMGMCGSLDPRVLAGPSDRATALALLAAREAVDDAALYGVDPAAFAVSVGTTLGNKSTWLDWVRSSKDSPQSAGSTGAQSLTADWTYGGPARAVARKFHAGQVHVVSTACASSNAALGTALDLIRDGDCEVVLAGGVDALQDFVISGFGALRAHSANPCRPFDRHRNGLNLGEGAAFLVLEAEQHARAHGHRIRAYLDGYGCSADAHHMTGPDREGRGMARSVLEALQDAEAVKDSIDFISLHGTATLFNDLMEAKGVHASFGKHASRVPVNSIKGTIGHTLGAAGALEAVMVVRALEEQTIPPTVGCDERAPDIDLSVVQGHPRQTPLNTVLSSSSGFGGFNAALVFRRGDP